MTDTADEWSTCLAAAQKFAKGTGTWNEDGTYVAKFEGGKGLKNTGPFEKTPKVRSSAPKQTGRSIQEVADAIVKDFNEDKCLLTGSLDLSAYDEKCIYKDPFLPPEGVPVEMFTDSCGPIEVAKSNCTTLGEPKIEGDTITLTFQNMMRMHGILPWPFYMCGTGKMFYTVKNGLIVMQKEIYINPKTGEDLGAAFITPKTLLTLCSPNFEQAKEKAEAALAAQM